MIDLHCHLLPGIDDGPKTEDEALALCRAALANGINQAVATPHITPGRYDNTLATITAAWQRLSSALQTHNIPLQLGMAAEVRLDPVIMAMVANDEAPFLGEYQGKRLLLLEFPHSHIPAGSDELTGWLLRRGVLPIIAHPERNREVMRDINKIQPFVKAGCLLQVTAGALTGVFGDVPQQRAAELLQKGWVSILASDAHNLHARKPDMAPGRRAAAEIIGTEESWHLVQGRPAEIARPHFG